MCILHSLEVRTRPFNFHSCLKLPEYNGLTIGNEYFSSKTGKRNFKSISNFYYRDFYSFINVFNFHPSKLHNSFINHKSTYSDLVGTAKLFVLLVLVSTTPAYIIIIFQKFVMYMYALNRYMNVISSTVKHKLKLLTNCFDCLHFGFFLLIRYIFLYFSLLKKCE